MRSGVRLGVDVGSVRIGVARCDDAGLLATPLVTISRGPGDLDQLGALAVQHLAIEFVVGLPLTMDGQVGPAATGVEAFVAELAQLAPCPVRLVDERLTTVTATRALRSAGRSSRTSRQIVDQQAAVEILQGALDRERAAGAPPGRCVKVDR